MGVCPWNEAGMGIWLKSIQVETDCLVMVNWLRGIEKVNTSFVILI